MSSLLTLVVSILVFGTVILVHEGGHFLAAKRCGVWVKEFSIGMGPLLWHKIKDGTQYSIRLLPIGGYNMMESEDGFEDEDDEDEPDAMPAVAAAKETALEPSKKGLWPVTSSGLPFGKATIGQRMFIIASGALMNFALGFVVLLVMVSTQEAISSKTIYGFGENALCQKTGLQAEDEILAVNGHHCFVTSDVVYELQRVKNYTAEFTVLRDGKRVVLPNVQFDVTTDEDGNIKMDYGFIVYGLRKTPANIMKETVNQFAYFARSIIRSFVDLAAGRVSVNDLSGPVGIVSAIDTAVRYGLQDVLMLAALITINLGIFNLLPLPALDGGRLVFLAIEGISGHAVPVRVQAAVNAAGMLLLLGLMVFVTIQDVARFL